MCRNDAYVPAIIKMAGTYSVTYVRNSEIKQLSTLFFAMLWDIDLIFGMWVYNDKLQIKFTFCSGQMIFGRVVALGLKFGQIFSCQHFFSMLGDIDLIFGLWVYNDELQIKFIFCSGPMNFGQLTAVELWNLAKYLIVITFFHYDLRYWLDFWYVNLRRLEDTDLKQ